MSLFETGLFCGHCMNQPCSCDNHKFYPIYFDMEFTGLHKYTTPISIGCVSQSGKTFYAEFLDFDNTQVDEWIHENVLENLVFKYNEVHPYETTYKNGVKYITIPDSPHNVQISTTRNFIKHALRKWLEIESIYAGNKIIRMHSDCLAYDWMLFIDLLCEDGEAIKLPEYINYIPIDLSTLIWATGMDPDISREWLGRHKDIPPEVYELLKTSEGTDLKHNSLWDAIIIKNCFEEIMKTRDRFENYTRFKLHLK